MKQVQGYVVGFIEYKDGVQFNRAVFGASQKRALAVEYLYQQAQRMIDGGHKLVEDYGDGCLLSGTGGYSIELEMYLCPILK